MKWVGAGPLLLAACAHLPPAPACPSGGEPYARTELYFGLRRPAGAEIEPGVFDAFVQDAVLPELASGFTLLDGQGRWLAQGKDTREPSRVLIVLHRGEPSIERGLERIRARYQELFAQQSVLRVDAPACARF